MIETVLQWAPVVFVGLVALLMLALSPAVLLLNLVTLPLGYQVTRCGHCMYVGVEKREYARCDWCGDRFAYYGVAAGMYGGDRERVFCSNEHPTAWKDAGEPDATPAAGEVAG